MSSKPDPYEYDNRREFDYALWQWEVNEAEGALNCVASSRERSDAARDAFYAAIVAAVDAGETVAAVARAAGLTRQAVYDIVRRTT